MSPILAALIPVVVATLGLDAFCLVDLAHAEEVRYLPRWAWAIVILFVSAPLGGVAYLVWGRSH